MKEEKEEEEVQDGGYFKILSLLNGLGTMKKKATMKKEKVLILQDLLHSIYLRLLEERTLLPLSGRQD